MNIYGDSALATDVAQDTRGVEGGAFALEAANMSSPNSRIEAGSTTSAAEALLPTVSFFDSAAADTKAPEANAVGPTAVSTEVSLTPATPEADAVGPRAVATEVVPVTPADVAPASTADVAAAPTAEPTEASPALPPVLANLTATDPQEVASAAANFYAAVVSNAPAQLVKDSFNQAQNENEQESALGIITPVSPQVLAALGNLVNNPPKADAAPPTGDTAQSPPVDVAPASTADVAAAPTAEPTEASPVLPPVLANLTATDPQEVASAAANYYAAVVSNAPAQLVKDSFNQAQNENEQESALGIITPVSPQVLAALGKLVNNPPNPDAPPATGDSAQSPADLPPTVDSPPADSPPPTDSAPAVTPPTATPDISNVPGVSAADYAASSRVDDSADTISGYAMVGYLPANYADGAPANVAGVGAVGGGGDMLTMPA